MNVRMIGVMIPLSTCIVISRSMRLPGMSATAAPITTCAVNRPRNSGASRNRRDTDRSAPTASATP